MGSRKGKPKQGILITGHKYQDGINVLRKSDVDVDVVDNYPEKGVKLGVRIGAQQSVAELLVGRAKIHLLPRDARSESELESNDPAGGESWRAWRVPRGMLPNDLHGFKTTFRVTPPIEVQTVKWAVVYNDQPFSGGYVIFGNADVGWKDAERAGRTAKRRPPSRPKPGSKKRGRRAS